jgi:hypothetical protein
VNRLCHYHTAAVLYEELFVHSPHVLEAILTTLSTSRQINEHIGERVKSLYIDIEIRYLPVSRVAKLLLLCPDVEFIYIDHHQTHEHRRITVDYLENSFSCARALRSELLG